MKPYLLLVLLVITGCQTALPVKVPGLAAAESKRDNCLQCAQLVERTVKQTGANAQWVSLPTSIPSQYHAICVLEHKDKTFAYDSQFGGMTDLRIEPSQVFGEKGNFIGNPDLIHRRARPRDFHGVHWGNMGMPEWSTMGL